MVLQHTSAVQILDSFGRKVLGHLNGVHLMQAEENSWLFISVELSNSLYRQIQIITLDKSLARVLLTS